MRNIIVHSNELITLTVPELWPFSENNYTNMLHVLNQRGLVKIEIMAIETSVEKNVIVALTTVGFFYNIYILLQVRQQNAFYGKNLCK